MNLRLQSGPDRKNRGCINEKILQGKKINIQYDN